VELTREEWQRQVDAKNEEIAQVSDDIEAIRNLKYHPRTTGSESYLRQLYEELADLMTRRPPE